MADPEWVFKEMKELSCWMIKGIPQTTMAHHGLLCSLLPSALAMSPKGSVHHLWSFVWKWRVGLNKAKTWELFKFLLMMVEICIVCPIWKRLRVIEIIPHTPSSFRHAALLGNPQRSCEWNQMRAENLRGMCLTKLLPLAAWGNYAEKKPNLKYL